MYARTKYEGCMKCLSSGLVAANISGKAKVAYQIQRNNALEKGLVPPLRPQRTKACHVCGGCGLVERVTTGICSNISYNGNTFIPRRRCKVVVIGGGIGGFALALALQQRNTQVMVYEKDKSFDERSQGYGLTLQQGARILSKLGYTQSLDQYGINPSQNSSFLPTGELLGRYERSDESETDHSRSSSEARNSNTHTTPQAGARKGTTRARVKGKKVRGGGGKHFNVQLPRQSLRRLLMNELEPGTVHWGHSFVSYQDNAHSANHCKISCTDAETNTYAGTDSCNHTDEGHTNRLCSRRGVDVTLSRTISTGGAGNRLETELLTVHADVLVGADGIWSLVRKQKMREAGVYGGQSRATCERESDHNRECDEGYAEVTRINHEVSSEHAKAPGNVAAEETCVGTNGSLDGANNHNVAVNELASYGESSGLRVNTSAALARSPALRFLGVMVILGFAPNPNHPLTENQMFQTMDGCTRIYTMPFTSPRADTELTESTGDSESPTIHHCDSILSDGDGSTMNACVGEAHSHVDPATIENQTMWQLSFPVTLEEAKALQALGADGLKQHAIKLCEGWHDPVAQILTTTRAANITGYPAFDRPAPISKCGHLSTQATPHTHRETPSQMGVNTLKSNSGDREPPESDIDPAKHSLSGCSCVNECHGGVPCPGRLEGVCAVDRRVTFVGDSAHPMSPFKGQGANQALLDGLNLAVQLASERCAAPAHMTKGCGDDNTVKRVNGGGPSGLATGPSQKKIECGEVYPPIPGNTCFSYLLSAYEGAMVERVRAKVEGSALAARVLHTPLALTKGNCTRVGAHVR